MRLTFTSTRTIHPSRVDFVRKYLSDSTKDGHEFTTGACIGGDALIALHMLELYPDATHRLVVPANRSQVDAAIVALFQQLEDERHIIEFMPPGTNYRDRNKRLLDHGDVLVAVAEYPEFDGHSKRSGTWMTVRIARTRDLPIRTLLLARS